MNIRFALTLAVLLALATPALATADTVTGRVFDAGLMADVQQPAVLRYRYEMRGQSIEQPFTSWVEMDVREVATDGQKSVFLDLFEGPNRRQYGPIAADAQNPLVIVFLQRDVTQMANLTGGAAGYFQQQIQIL